MPVMLRRLWIQLTADRKRFGLLCAMLTVGLLLWARVIVVSNIPRTVAAEESAGAMETTDRQIRANTAIMDRLARQKVAVRLDDLPLRDPFVISPDYFPKPQFDGQISQEAAKSGQKHDEDKSVLRQRQRYELTLKQADRLKLEAVMRGAGIAVISGRTYQIGEMVPGPDDESVLFELLEVKQRSIVLKSEVHEFELELDRKGIK